jgi:hypothetical protein
MGNGDKTVKTILVVLALSIGCLAQTGRKDGFNCVVAVATATTATVGCASVYSTRAMYVTDITFGSSAASGTAADSFPTLKYGTGSTCGTGTVVFWQSLTAANTTVVSNQSTPIKIPKGNDICWIMSTAGSKTIQIQGFYGDAE